MTTPTDSEGLKQLLEKLVRRPSTAFNSYFGRDQLFKQVNYEDLSRDAKGCLAQYFIKESCSRIGGFSLNGDVRHFLSRFADELDAAPNYEPFGMRKQEHLAFAIRLAFLGPSSPGSAVGAFYLLGQLEGQFRVLSSSLDVEGRWKDGAAQQAAFSRLDDNRIKKRRINDIALAYRIFLLDDKSEVVKAFAELERVLPESQILNEHGHLRPVDDIRDRLSCLRHPASHGFYGDISSEGPFYTLLWALLYFCA